MYEKPMQQAIQKKYGSPTAWAAGWQGEAEGRKNMNYFQRFCNMQRPVAYMQIEGGIVEAFASRRSK